MPYLEKVDAALQLPMFGMSEDERNTHLLLTLKSLTAHHCGACEGYGNLVNAMFPGWAQAEKVHELPFLPVGIFKQRSLKSIPDADVFRTITSSGTTGQQPSQVLVDRETANRQTRALSLIMREVLGETRRPMLIIDAKETLIDRTRNARAAGIIGMMPMGRHHKFLLNSEMELQLDRLKTFSEENKGVPTLIFGFTFMVWQYFAQELKAGQIDLSTATLIHSGGWKQLEHIKVDNNAFKEELFEKFGIRQVVNFYGMAEQVGSVFIEGKDGLLHPSILSDVIIRNPNTWEPQPIGERGVIQVLSTIPTSYPGHSILTEDEGVIESINRDGAEFAGKALRVIGRLPKAELRGCSDTHAAGLNA